MENPIKKILKIPSETQNLEFKRLSGNKVVTKIIQTIVAMANTEGGVIILGIDDPEKSKKLGEDRIFGIEEDIDLYDTIGREVQKISPIMPSLWPPEIINVHLAKGGEKRVAILRVSKVEDCFRSINNHVYMRQMRSNKLLSPQEIVKFNYAKGFEKSDKEIVDINFDLLQTVHYDEWRKARGLSREEGIQKNLYKTGLALTDKNNKLKPTRAAIMLFAEFPTNLLETKCAIRVYRYTGTIEQFNEVPNLIGRPKTIEGSIIKLISDAHQYILDLLADGIEISSGFKAKYKIPERAMKEAITNSVIHRDYHIKRDIEIKVFQDRIEVLSPGLFPYNITKNNIGKTRADGYRNDLLVKHLREFPEPPNLDRNEGVQAMRNEMTNNNLYPPVFFTYPFLEDSVEVTLLNEERPDEWEKVFQYLSENQFIDNQKAREITGIPQTYQMSRLFSNWTGQGLIEIYNPNNKAPRYTKYTLPNKEDI